MIEDESKSEDKSRDSDEFNIVIIPIKTMGHTDPRNEVIRESEVIRSILAGGDESSSAPPSSDDSGKDQLEKSRLSFHSVSDDPESTRAAIEQSTGVTDDESLSQAAKCGAFWKSLGAETVIYMASYGGGLLANGLIIRFAGLDPLLGTLAFGSYSGLSYHNARIFFTSLIKPPQDDLPEGKRSTFHNINKYAFLPLSWIVASSVSGTILSILGDDSFATQQAIGVPTSLVIGPIMGGLGALTRECLGGSVIIEPDYENQKTVGMAFRTAYGTGSNPLDDDRSYRFGTIRDVFLRFLSINLGTIASFAIGAANLSTFCIGGREDFLNATRSGNQTDVNELLNEHCLGGQATYAFRELGFSLCYGLGVLVVEPVLGKVFNLIYDYLYPRDQTSSDDDSIQIEEVSGDEV